MASKGKPKTISQILEEVSVIANGLENNEIALEQMISDYEKGIDLIRAAQEQLASAELKIKTISASERSSGKGED